MGRIGGGMGRVGGQEPGGFAALDARLGVLEALGLDEPDLLFVPAELGDTSDGTKTLTAAAVWTMLAPIPVGKTLTAIHWIFNGASGGTKTMALREMVTATGAAATVDSTTSALSGLRSVTQTVSPEEVIATGRIYTLRFTAGNNGDVLYGAALEFAH